MLSVLFNGLIYGHVSLICTCLLVIYEQT